LLIKASKTYLHLLCWCLLLSALLACGGRDGGPVLKVGGIPDQDASRLARRYQGFSDYLSQQLGVPVRYIPSVDYAAVVTAFTQGELQLAFFGGLTGVQARLQNQGAQVIAQRGEDASFHSKFIVKAGLPIYSLRDLKTHAGELTITFGSESSTSGHLMPRHFLLEAGIDPEDDFKSVANFSGSHDLTWQLVASGAFDVGALNEKVWGRAVRQERVDTSKVREFYTTPEYFDYNWTVQGGLDQVYGTGFADRTRLALLALNPEEHKEILELFNTERFVESRNSNYQDIEKVARDLGIIR
jgi:phosphonate transport system substrate-binding protein